MVFPQKWCRFIAIAVAWITAGLQGSAGQMAMGQSDRTSSQQSQAAGAAVPDWLNAMMTGGKSAWSDEQLKTMEQLRDEAMKSPYAYEELQHLTNNIGPRLSGSPQAQKAVDWVADEMRKLGAEVTLEKAEVPHWVRGGETGELTAWPGQASGTTQKIVLTALGGSVATPPEGITAEVVVVDNWREFRALPAGAVKGKILLFNRACGNGARAGGLRWKRCVSRSWADRRRCSRSGGSSGAERRWSRFPAAAHGGDRICDWRNEDTGSGGYGRRCGIAEGVDQ